MWRYELPPMLLVLVLVLGIAAFMAGRGGI
jgi:hypothetical protein